MQNHRQERAVIERFEGPYAVLLVGDARKPLDVPRRQLPRRAKEGVWLLIEMSNNTVVSAQIDIAATEEARTRIQDKLARLRRGDHLTDEQ